MTGPEETMQTARMYDVCKQRRGSTIFSFTFCKSLGFHLRKHLSFYIITTEGNTVPTLDVGTGPDKRLHLTE